MRGRPAVLLVSTILGAALLLPVGVGAEEPAPPPAAPSAEGSAATPSAGAPQELAAPAAVGGTEAAPQEPAPAQAAAGPEAAPPVSGEAAPAAEAPGPSADNAAAYPDGLVHEVVQGDTLWDLSAKYLGSPWKWQELWERNRFLTNPHYIYPGIKIVIFPPPSRDYAFAAQKPEAPPEAPPPPPEPEVKEAPPPPPRVPTLDILPSEFVRAGVFQRERPSGIGAIRGGDDPQALFSKGDRVLLKLKREFPAGQMLGVYRVRGPITTPGSRPVTGYVKYLAGIVQSGGSENSGSFGVIRDSFEDLDRNNVIFEEIPSYAPVILSPAAEGTTATVIAGQEDNEELSRGDFVYLDRGSSAGIAPGNGFRLFDVVDVSEGATREMKTSARIEVGEAVVVRVSPEFSTAYVVKSTRSFSAGVKAIAGPGAAKGK